MKTLVFIGIIFRQDVGDLLFDSLVQIYPGGQTGSAGHAFELMLPTDDPRVEAVISKLEAAGVQREGRDVAAAGSEPSYSYVLHRKYDLDELSQFEFLQLLAPSGAYEQLERAGNGELMILEGGLPGERPVDQWDFIGAYAEDPWIFVPTRVKILLQISHLRGLSFRPAQYWPKGCEMDDLETLRRKVGTPYWELDSDVDLPPVSPTNDLRNDKGDPAPAGLRVRVVPHEGDYAIPELHYRAADLKNLPPFDIARTYENFGLVPTQEYQRWYSKIIVSRRFFEACRQHGLNADWVPVHIDPS